VNRLLDGYCRVLKFLLVIMLAVMVVLVFGNVVMRYAFNSGITVSEEVSRWLFVWLTFLGALIAIRTRGHLGTDVLVGRLGPAGKKACAAISYALMLWVNWLIFKGSWQQAVINASVAAPVTGASMAIVYSVGVVFAVSAAVMLVADAAQLLLGRVSDRDLVMIQESEELAQLQSLAVPPAKH
jgi:TRAP-type transport system small permease protein